MDRFVGKCCSKFASNQKAHSKSLQTFSDCKSEAFVKIFSTQKLPFHDSVACLYLGQVNILSNIRELTTSFPEEI